MKTKEKSLRELLADIQKASELERYDPAAAVSYTHLTLPTSLQV